MNTENTYVIGDVHGCYFTLLNLVSKLPENSKLIFVGDLGDRGLFTSKVFDFVIDNKHSCVLGNHDKYMLDNSKEFLNGNEDAWRNSHPYLGSSSSIENYSNNLLSFKKHVDFIENMPEYIIIDNYFITHGFGLPYYLQRDSDSRGEGLFKCRIKDKNTNWASGWDKDYMNHPVTNIFGHNIYPEVEIGPNEKYYGIDTGVSNGGKLSALKLGNMEVISSTIDPRDLP